MHKLTLVLILIISCCVLFACTRKDDLPKPENTILGSQLDPLNKAKKFETDHDEALDRKRRELDRAIDGGGH
jgi:hypothetical protein